MEGAALEAGTPEVNGERVAAITAATLARSGRPERNEIRFRCVIIGHDDVHPSARWNPDKRVWRCDVCGVGGGWIDLEKRLDLAPAPKAPAARDRRVVERYDYRDVGGVLRFQVQRHKDKSFSVRRPKAPLPPGSTPVASQDGWRMGLGDVPHILYRLELLSNNADALVFVPEGEKDVDTLVRLGQTATCNPFGAGKWRLEYSQSLRDRNVVILPDNDAPGRAHAESVAAALHNIAATVKILALPDLPEKGDVSDWIAAGHTAEELHRLATEAPTWAAAIGESAIAEPDDAAIFTLAALPALEYDRRRVAEAERLGVRVTTLDAERERLRRVADEDDDDEHDHDGRAPHGGGLTLNDPAPCAEPVDGAALLAEIHEIYLRFLVLPPQSAIALALWTLFAWALDAFEVSPLIAACSPEKRCGKTTLLHIIHALTPRAVYASNITAAALYRAVERFRPTLVIDEADTFLRGSDELRGVMNAGHTRTSAVVIRTVGDDHEPRTFSVWCPKAIAMIGRLPDTLEDRAIVIGMQRRGPGDRPVARLRLDRLSALESIGPKAARWVADHVDALRQADPDVPDELHDRAADNWRPLLAIADQAGGDWPEAARKAARELSGVKNDITDATKGVALLRDLRRYLGESEHITTETLLNKLVTFDDEAPWPTWNKGKPITARQVAALLKPFGIRSDQVHPENAKGYRAAACLDAFRRYLSADPNMPNNANGNTYLGSLSHPNGGPSRSDHESSVSRRILGDCSARSDQGDLLTTAEGYDL